jgi:hypothetical protein
MSTNDTTSIQSRTGLPLFIHHLDKTAQSLGILSTAQTNNTSVDEWKREIAELKADFEASLNSTEDPDPAALVETEVSRQHRLDNLGERIQSDLRDRLAPEHMDDQSRWTKDQLQHYDALSHFMQDATDETQPPQDQRCGQDDPHPDAQGGDEN